MLATLPYTAATVVWMLGDARRVLAATRAIVGDRIGYLLALAFPAVLCERRHRPERLSHRGANRRHA